MCHAKPQGASEDQPATGLTRQPPNRKDARAEEEFFSDGRNNKVADTNKGSDLGNNITLYRPISLKGESALEIARE